MMNRRMTLLKLVSVEGLMPIAEMLRLEAVRIVLLSSAVHVSSARHLD